MKVFVEFIQPNGSSKYHEVDANNYRDIRSSMDSYFGTMNFRVKTDRFAGVSKSTQKCLYAIERSIEYLRMCRFNGKIESVQFQIQLSNALRDAARAYGLTVTAFKGYSTKKLGISDEEFKQLIYVFYATLGDSDDIYEKVLQNLCRNSGDVDGTVRSRKRMQWELKESR